MDRAVQFLVCHGDAVLFTWVFAEQAGLPIPTILLLLAAGSLASAGRMNLAWSVADFGRTL
jgi:membrane protein DedA with SNARE-associated domain